MGESTGNPQAKSRSSSPTWRPVASTVSERFRPYSKSAGRRRRDRRRCRYNYCRRNRFRAGGRPCLRPPSSSVAAIPNVCRLRDTRVADELPPLAQVDVCSHEIEQMPGRDPDCLAMTAHVSQGDPTENTPVTHREIVDIAPIPPKLDRRGVHPTLEARELHRVSDIAVGAPYLAAHERARRSRLFTGASSMDIYLLGTEHWIHRSVGCSRRRQVTGRHLAQENRQQHAQSQDEEP
jgi:hypothetical protein